MNTAPNSSWPPPCAIWYIKLLGSFEIVSNSNEPVRFRSRTSALVLAYLSIHKSRESANEELQELFWPESDGDRQAQNLRRAIADLRKVLEDGLPLGSVIATRKGYVSLNSDRVATDFQRFQDLIKSSGEKERQCNLTKAISLYSGPLLAPMSDARVMSLRMELEESYGQAVDELCEILTQQGNCKEAINIGRAAVVAAPSREDIHIALIKAYRRSGMSVEALRQFEEVERILDDTWGESPSQKARDALEAAFEPYVPPYHNLPEQLTSFIGREKQIGEVCELLFKTRLLTLTGSGGCGKTRLSLQVASRMLDQYPDGVWFVEFAPLADPGLVTNTVAAVLGLTEQPSKTFEQTLLDYLKSKRLLLVLDNCEHLLLVCAQLAEAIVRNCPSVVILANSREGLAIGAESVYRLPSLSLPNPKEPQTTESLAQFESVQLFVERAVQVQRAFAVTDQNAPALASVCQRLDGIPLAIELAAARLRSLSVEEINGKLDQRFRLLTGGSRTALPRQQTLRSLIDWSFDLLNESEKALLRRLAVFAGGWTLESAEQVCADEPVEELSMLDLITSLCDKNLVVAEQADEPTRYGMLETIRQYARDRLLESGEGKEMRDRHLAYFLALAEEAEPQLIGPGQLEWLARLEIELDNLRATLTWSSTFGGNIEAGLRISGAISRFWNLHCHQNEGLGWLDCFLTQDSNWQTAAARSKALHAAGVLAYELRDYPRAKALLDESLVSHCDLGDQRGIAKSLNGLGNVAMEEGDYPAARTLHEQSLVIRSELDDRTGVATSLNNLGVVALWSGDFAAADTFAKGSLLISRELGVKGLIASSLATIGEVAQEQRDFPTAGSAYRQSLGIFRKLGDNRLVAYLLVHLASVHSALADPDRAAHLYGAVERVRELNKWPLSPRDRSEFEQQVAAARTSLGDDVAFDRAWQEGRNVTLGQAIELALATSAEGV